MNLQEIPLTPNNQLFSITLAGQLLNMRIIWRDAAGWVMDLMNSADEVLISGASLVPGVDLLAQYKHLGIKGALVVAVENTAEQYPNKNNLGLASHLYFIPESP